MEEELHQARRGGTHKEIFTVKCAFMYDVYGIVKKNIVIIKVKNFVSVSHIIPPILPKCPKTREPKDECCVS